MARSRANRGDRPVMLTGNAARRINRVVQQVERGNRNTRGQFITRAQDEGEGGGGLPIRLAQTSGPWPNEPPLNVKAVQLFKQPANPAGPADWVPETDEFGDPVFAVAINWFSHIPVGQGDLIKWCAIVPISDLPGEYDTGQVISSIGSPDVPIKRPYGKLWLLLAAEC